MVAFTPPALGQTTLLPSPPTGIALALSVNWYQV